MAFRFWQIGLHIQQHEALAVAVVRGASGWSLQRWRNVPSLTGISASQNSSSMRCFRGVVRFLTGIIFISLSLPAGRCKSIFRARKWRCANVNKRRG